MNKQQLNSLVVSHRDGNEEALIDIFNAVNPLIERTSRELEMIVENYTKFDCRIVTKIKRLIETFDESTDDFLSIVKALIGNEKAFMIRREKNRPNRISSEYLEEQAEEFGGFEFEDEQVNVESDVLYREKVTLLSEGNSKKETILTQWSKGANDVAISELLSQLYGGKAETNRRYITRFKKESRETLLSEGLA